MGFSSWLAKRRRFGGGVRRQPPTSLSKRSSARPRLEALEDRTLPSTFLVTNLGDSGTGSLRAAVAAADSTSGAVIDFAPSLHGTITLTSGQLNLSRNVTIDGPGANKLTVSGNNGPTRRSI